MCICISMKKQFNIHEDWTCDQITWKCLGSKSHVLKGIEVLVGKRCYALLSGKRFTKNACIVTKNKNLYVLV